VQAGREDQAALGGRLREADERQQGAAAELRAELKGAGEQVRVLENLRASDAAALAALQTQLVAMREKQEQNDKEQKEREQREKEQIGRQESEQKEKALKEKQEKEQKEKQDREQKEREQKEQREKEQKEKDKEQAEQEAITKLQQFQKQMEERWAVVGNVGSVWMC
jgi:outer membrane biosynthesis protein TonB